MSNVVILSFYKGNGMMYYVLFNEKRKIIV